MTKYPSLSTDFNKLDAISIRVAAKQCLPTGAAALVLYTCFLKFARYVIDILYP